MWLMVFWFYLTAPPLEQFEVQPDSPETRLWVNFLEFERAEQTREALQNARAYIRPLQRSFVEEGVPKELAWLAMIESSFRVASVSPTGAVGMFQFKAETARAMGLRVDRRHDDRLRPLIAGRAAARYLAYLYAKFKDWDLVLAAYNLGEGDLRRTMEAQGASTWLEVKPFVRKETQQYVGKIKAAALIGETWLERYPQDAIAGADTYTVQPGDTLYSIARNHNVNLELLKAHNGLTDNVIHPGRVLHIPGNQ